MVDAITGFVVEKMGNYLIENTSMLMGVDDELQELRTELMCIQGYLKDVEAREKEDNASKEWTKLVLDIAYDIEDVLDTYNLKSQERSQRRGLMRLTNKLGEKRDAYNVLGDIKTLKRRILDVTRKRATYGIGNINMFRARENTSSFRVRQLRRARSFDQEERVVGLEDDANILLEKLLEEGDNKRYMISIFGMGGLGKTALARKLYNSSLVKTRFECFAWTYVSQEYNTSDVLMRIIRSLGVGSEEDLEKIRMLGVEDLERYLYGLLKGKKYLLVVDDIWEREAWVSLKRALPGNHNGSRVIITTRIKDVAERLDERVYAHKLRFLTFEESWNLFEQKAFRDIKQDQELEKIGKEMVKKCGGLPLAIVLVLAGVMSRKEPNEWNDVYASLWRRLKDDNILISTVFGLSFKELEPQLKLCFLYLSVFPEDYAIDVETLIRLLVAEGFILEDEAMMMEDVARDYIEELIDRSLLEAVTRKRGRLLFCRIHDLLRDEAVKKAKELNFLNVNNEQHASSSCRREVVHHLIDKNYLCDRRVNQRMRSFLLFRERNGMNESCVESITLKFKFLRVLHLIRVRFDRKGKTLSSLPDVIGDLIHLRYLGIENMFTRSVPAFISNLQLLQTLDVSGSCIYGTTDLRKLTSLRHVMGGFYEKLLIGDAVNLQTLRFITSYSWSKLKNREFLKNLRNLEIKVSRSPPKFHVDLDSFSKLTNLRVLELWETTLKLPLESKNAVDIFPSLESLTLIDTDLEEDLMLFLQKLPRLEDLVLQRCNYSGPKMSISAHGFPRLRILKLILKKLDELQIEEEAMPNLKNLIVWIPLLKKPKKMLIPNRLLAILTNREY